MGSPAGSTAASYVGSGYPGPDAQSLCPGSTFPLSQCSGSGSSPAAPPSGDSSSMLEETGYYGGPGAPSVGVSHSVRDN